MAYDFPNAPALGQEVIAPLGAAYQWDGSCWRPFPGVPAGNAYMQLSGGVMTGPLTLAGNAVGSLDAVPLQQVNAIVGNYLPLTGGHVTGTLQVDGAVQANTTLSMTQPAPTGADVGQVFATNDVVSGSLAWNAYSFGGSWRTVATGPSATATAQPTGLFFSVAPAVAAGAVPALTTRLDLRNDVALAEVAGNLVASSATSPAIGVTNTAVSVTSGIYAPSAARPLSFGILSATGAVTTQLGYFDSGGNLTVTGRETVGGQGIQYANYSGSHTHAFSWDGSFVNGIVDGSNVGQLASVSWTQSWVNGQGYATNSYVNSTFATNSNLSSNYATQSWVNGNFKPIGAYTPNQNVDSGSSPHFFDLFAYSIRTTSTSSDYFAFWVSGGCYIRMDNTYDYGPIGYASDERLKRDILPSELDCLDVLRRVELKRFLWKDDDAPQVPVGFTTQQLATVLPALVNAQPKDMPPLAEGAVHYESVNHNIMLAVIVGALQQLDRRLAAGEEPHGHRTTQRPTSRARHASHDDAHRG